MLKGACLIALLCALSVVDVTNGQVFCEKVVERGWELFVGTHLTCWFANTASISTDTTTLSATPSIQVMGFFARAIKGIFYLPTNTDEIYPNLIAYDASNCAIKAISRKNFKNQRVMKMLWLQGNDIETIYGDTFADLVALHWLYLNVNKIKAINSQAFANQNFFETVLLAANVCILEDFADPTRIAKMKTTIDSKCAFAETYNASAVTTTIATPTTQSPVQTTTPLSTSAQTTTAASAVTTQASSGTATTQSSGTQTTSAPVSCADQATITISTANTEREVCEIEINETLNVTQEVRTFSKKIQYVINQHKDLIGNLRTKVKECHHKHRERHPNQGWHGSHESDESNESHH